MTLKTQFESLSVDGINEYIATKQEEHLQLDFKTINKSDLSHRDDRKTLAKALSGFSNSSGGLIIWGVVGVKDTTGIDCAVGKQEIDQLKIFISRLNELTGQAVSPIVDGVQHKPIFVEEDRGFAITLVPESDSGPHMAKLGEHRYYKRSGAGFYKMEHFDLEDMFGRRRRPNLIVRADPIEIRQPGQPGAKLLILISIENIGRGTAKTPFLSIDLSMGAKLYEYGVDGNNNTGLPIIRKHIGSGSEQHFGANTDIVIHPDMILDITQIKISVPNPPSDLIFTYKVGAENMRTHEESVVISAKNIKKVKDNYSQYK